MKKEKRIQIDTRKIKEVRIDFTLTFPNKEEFDELLRKMANLSKEGEAAEKEKKNPQK